MAVSDGMTYGWTSPMIPYFMSNSTHIEMSSSDADWMETINLLGYVAGLPFTILSVEYFGRKTSMILSAMLGCVCWILLLVTMNLPVIYVSRFLAGMAGDMCFVAAPMYIAEISDYRIRGFLSSLIYFMMIVGILIVYCTGALAPYWVTPAVGIFFTACQSVFVFFLPESPYYYVYKNQIEKAKKALRRLRAHDDVDKEIGEIEKEVERERKEKGRPRDLIMIKSNRFALFICLILNGGQHFVGISVFLMNLQIILEEANSEYIESSTASIMFALLMLISTGVASAFIDKYGRRFLLISSSFTTGLALLVLSIFFHLQYNGHDVSGLSWIPAACVMIYAATFKVGLGLVPIVMIAEIFPTTVKALGMTVADVFYVLGAVLSINLYQVFYDKFGLHVPLYIFAACSIGMMLVTIFWIPETKGKTLDEVQLMLKGEFVKKDKNKNELKIKPQLLTDNSPQNIFYLNAENIKDIYSSNEPYISTATVATSDISPTDTNTLNDKLLTNIIENQGIIIENQATLLESLKGLGTNDNKLIIFQQLSKFEAMADVMAEKMTNMNSINNCSCKKSSQIVEDIYIDRIEAVEQFDAFESKLKDRKIMQENIERLSQVCGKRGDGHGVNNCYILIDRMFSRKFMTLCSWAGGARGEQEKVAYKMYKNVISLFFNVVHLSDKSFTQKDCEDFIKNVIRNSTRRSKSDLLRTSAIKRRLPKKPASASEEMEKPQEKVDSNDIIENEIPTLDDENGMEEQCNSDALSDSQECDQ
ncbi:unnamed protein product [Ceutorhynchus assimilis]|uniref:DUF4806 domain-containing protein n=1 Tax=Ceutorhynchus assimilis TaxID=467358 RepID=A0A9N9MNS0_9CUCU|nr:unnamed protein product [Ceutorhynchus assimilis]